ncbi:MAG: AraC family transcriptional regulator [Acidobacteria bacterium]|nr:AraC family transcriptional regulator [Acidobacteriota bacterium]
MTLKRPAHPLLQPYVVQFWYHVPRNLAAAGVEYILPDGTMHITLREHQPLELYESSLTLGRANLSGIHTRYYAKINRPSACLGCQLRPASTRALFGIPADQLVNCHLSLAELWPRSEVDGIVDRVIATPNPNQKLDIFESFLLDRLRPIEIPELLAFSLGFLAQGQPIQAWIAKSGYSHRYMKELFRQWMGVTPKMWQRIHRLNRVTNKAWSSNRAWSDLALDAGFSDQAHLTREFREIAGVSPSTFRKYASAARHVPFLHEANRKI